MSTSSAFRRIAGWALLLAAACATPSGRVAAHPFVGRFVACLAFVPDGMDSLWLTDLRGLQPDEGLPRCEHLELRCGRDHDSWPGWQYLQTYDGVLIEDYGTSAVPAARRALLGEPAAPVEGFAVWHLPQHTMGVDQVVSATWSTVVDERFVVVADTEPLLRAALRRSGGSIAGSMVAAVDAPADAVSVVYHKFRTLRFADVEAPELDWTAMLVAAAPPRVEWWGPVTKPRLFHDDPRPPAHRWHGTTHVWCWSPQGEAVEDVYGLWVLGLAAAFGMMVFI